MNKTATHMWLCDRRNTDYDNTKAVVSGVKSYEATPDALKRVQAYIQSAASAQCFWSLK